jgi:hypothetical protein
VGAVRPERHGNTPLPIADGAGQELLHLVQRGARLLLGLGSHPHVRVSEPDMDEGEGAGVELEHRAGAPGLDVPPGGARLAELGARRPVLGDDAGEPAGEGVLPEDGGADAGSFPDVEGEMDAPGHVSHSRGRLSAPLDS